MKRKIGLAFILILVVSLINMMAATAFGQTLSVPTPYVPEFSVTYIASIHLTNSTNQYTGATTIITFYADSVQIAILNQAFNVNALENSLVYNVQEKGEFTEQWISLAGDAAASSSEYTVLNLTLADGFGNSSIPLGAQLDFQVQASLGYYALIQEANPFGNPPATYLQWIGVNSAWSNTQTIEATNGSTSTSISNSPYPTFSPTPLPTSNQTVTSSSNSTSASPAPAPTSNSTLTSANSTATPQNPTVRIQTKTGAGFNWTPTALVIAVAVIVALVVVVVTMTVRHRKTANFSKDLSTACILSPCLGHLDIGE